MTRERIISFSLRQPDLLILKDTAFNRYLKISDMARILLVQRLHEIRRNLANEKTKKEFEEKLRKRKEGKLK